ncbi:PLP-dependent aminotransferase family protein [Pseudodesulfovibrio sp.]|uniref:aminotransferase-like domain-containing protein n=1 Tax=Pseudodesulfovibrio sp. TaxID=2035812 RepID=UPI0026288BBC|nr:PLP-dependent aminotransferase family protein [Pseudodesulfovibrio sp.]MDD3310567.1 PLP-dependent aminotransferase family protein [Pseudodesulfovibrio sp.]
MENEKPASPDGGNVELGSVSPLPHLDPDPTTAFARIAERGNAAGLLRCADPRGLPEHRRAGAEWAARFLLDAKPGEVVICAGAQHALACCLAALSQPGHRIAVDPLTYPGLIALAATFGLHLIPVPMDDQGMLPDRLDALCRNHTIHGLYLMPGAHNPTGVRMPPGRREALASLARKHDLLVIEDDAYALTDPDRTPPVAALARERAFFIAGLSKTLAPGLRIAYLVTPPHQSKTLGRSVENSLRMTPPLTAEIAAAWIMDHTADQVLQAKLAETARRNDLARDTLGLLPARYRPHQFFLWLPLPDPWTARSFEQAARERGVNLLGAHHFAPNPDAAPAAIRLSLTAETNPDRLKTGLETVAGLLRGE